MKKTVKITSILKSIAEIEALWAESVELDARAIQTSDERLHKKLKQLCEMVCALEYSVATAEAKTVEEHDARCALIARTMFDAADMVAIAFRVGLDAQRLGLGSALPGCFSLSPGLQ